MTTTPAAPNLTPNGPVAAAILACGLGCFLLGILAVAADGSKSLAAALNFYNPSGPLSGVTTVAIAVWLIAWAILAARWKDRTFGFAKVAVVGSVNRHALSPNTRRPLIAVQPPCVRRGVDRIPALAPQVPQLLEVGLVAPLHTVH